jgi:hypothetical protein
MWWSTAASVAPDSLRRASEGGQELAGLVVLVEAERVEDGAQAVQDDVVGACDVGGPFGA